MKKALAIILSIPMIFTLCACGNEASGSEAELTYNWETADKQYEHFTDMGNYVLTIDDADYTEFDEINKTVEKESDLFSKFGCTATVKKNSEGEVIVGRNMDVEISQCPTTISKIKGGKYKTVTFNYGGAFARYKYNELDKLDSDVDFAKTLPFTATDAFNEKGLYVEVNMREMDNEYDMYCKGTNPKADVRACTVEAPALITLNCGTVDEALEYLDTVNWYTSGLHNQNTNTDVLWNMGLIIGDAEGNYGLIEFGKNKVYYTPYANGQGNYFIHPELAEYAIYGSGYGRFAAALEGLPECETEEDMMKNMESCMWRREILDPGCLGYSDHELDVNKRRETSQEELQSSFEKELLPKQDMIKKYYNGDEKELRDDGTVWTTTFNFGVNCAKKHLILRLYEKDDVMVECQW